uniref:Large ribosomal subunit protein mL40 n=1 Tax=Graphocephala atropunctata TaxID=36148 RepID=A0A1B6KI01_9HEMI
MALSILSSLRRLTLNEKIGSSIIARSVSTDSPLYFQVTQFLCAEPLKKKKRLDPAIVRAREEKRKKKLEKQIRRLEKNARQTKPIDECEVPMVLLEPEELKIRQRKIAPLTSAQVDERVRLTKDWTRYRYRQAIGDISIVERLAHSQARALQELRQESEELYQEAIQVDPALLPFSVRGPVVTPPIPDYESPDGEYVDITKKWT